jgi:predicted Fe-Mo cluster-binding NifX family protein
MRYAIPLLGDRVSPRCTIADRLLIVTTSGNHIQSQRTVGIVTRSWNDFISLLLSNQVDTFICGGVSVTEKHDLSTKTISVIDNVAGTGSEILRALLSGNLKPGLGLQESGSYAQAGALVSPSGAVAGERLNGDLNLTDSKAGRSQSEMPDCLACQDRVCLQGKRCDPVMTQNPVTYDDIDRRMIDSAVDIACEEDRTLCRLSELFLS